MLKKLLKFDNRCFKNKPGKAFRDSGVLPEAERLPLASGRELGDARRQAWRKEHIDLCWGKKPKPAEQKLVIAASYFHCFKERQKVVKQNN